MTKTLDLDAFRRDLGAIWPDALECPVSDIESILARDSSGNEQQLSAMRQIWRDFEYDRELPESPWTVDVAE